MSISPYALHVGLLTAVLLIGYVMYMSTLRKKAAFSLYKVRDQFVYLVAEGTITEDSEVFQHYYKRINVILSLAPNVGVDDILHIVFNDFKTMDEFQASVKQSEKLTDKILKMEEFGNKAVMCAAGEYYSAMRAMILSHSSIIRTIYILLGRSLPALNNKLTKTMASAIYPIVNLIPSAKRGIDTVRFMENAETKTTGGCCVAH